MMLHSLSLLAMALAVLAVGSSASPLPAASSSSSSASSPPSFDRSARGRLALADAARPPIHDRRQRRPAAAAPPQPRDDADPYRLPTALRPVHYKITLTPNLSSFTFDGKIEIRFNAIESTNMIVLHAKQIMFNMDDCNVYWDSAEEGLSAFGAVTGITFDKDTERATLYLDSTFTAGQRYAIIIDKFTGKLNDDLDGFYRSSYKTSTGETRWLATTQFEPTGARRAFPCWDEPGYKSRYDIIIRHDPALKALSNLPLAPPDDGRLSRVSDDGMVEDAFTTTLPMSSYLVAFVVSDFESVSNADQTFTTWARKDIVAGASLSQEVGPLALKALADFNGVDYSLTKMDQAAIPDFAAGAMENWGLVTYREDYLIVTPKTTTKLRERIATAICHEFGHQWTGDLVTLDWWEHTWLNEGFASFYESMICAQIKPEWNLEDKMVTGFYHVAMESDVRETQVPMSAAVHSYDQIEDRFGVISYNKGGSVLRMFYHVLTPDVFKKAMKRYLSDYMFHNANPGLLFKAFNAELELSNQHQIPMGASFAEVASTWTEQAGVPVLNAVRNYKDGTIDFSQQRFLYPPVVNASLLAQNWFIPLVVTSQAKPDFDSTVPQGWLDPGVVVASLPTEASADQWVLVNPKQTGYFRVNYDEANWKLLAAALATKPSDVHPASRAQLLNDALSLARAGQLGYGLALPFLPPLKQERSVVVWQAAVTALDYLLARLGTTDANDALLSVIEDVTSAAYGELGYRVAADEDHEKAFLRYYVASYACRGGSAQCLSDAAAALKAWLADATASPLQPDTRDTSLCFGVRGSDAATFEAMRKAWQAETDADTKYTYASALACSKDQSLLQGLMKDALAKKYGADDGVTVFNAIYDHTWNHRLLYDFTKENADAMRAAFGNNFDVQVLNGIIRDIRTRQELKEIQAWVQAKYGSQTDSWQTLQQGLSAAERELSTWFDKYYVDVAAWLQRAPTPATTARPTAGPTGGPTGGPTTPGHEATTAKGGASAAAASATGLLITALLCTAVFA